MTDVRTGDQYLAKHLDSLQADYRGRDENAAPVRSRFRFFHECLAAVLSGHIRRGDRVLDLGCTDGQVITRSEAGEIVGIDIDARAICEATDRYPQHRFIEGSVEETDLQQLGQFDVIVMSGLLEQLYDIQTVLDKVAAVAAPRTRLVVASYSRVAQPVLRLFELAGFRRRPSAFNWVPPSEVKNMLEQCGFEVVTTEPRILLPFRVPVLSKLVNRWLAPLPLLRAFCMITVTVARPRLAPQHPGAQPSVSVVIAARNESGNIGPLLDRIPAMSDRQEVVLIEGGSTDDTWATIQAEIAARRQSGYPFELICAKQTGKGKGDAVREGFGRATGDILMILDADISVPPEELPRFVELLRSGSCEFANGSRLVYPMDDKAMQFLNLIGNRFFGLLFSYLLGQPIRDTLCGTKVLWADDYRRIAAGRSHFGEFDPFGDFDLLFGAARLGLRIRDVPVHYKERVYGSTNISRFRHGVLLLKMCAVAARRLRFT